MLFNGPDNPPKRSFPCGISTPSNTQFVRPTQVNSFQMAHLDRSVQQFFAGLDTDTQTDHNTPSVAVKQHFN